MEQTNSEILKAESESVVAITAAQVEAFLVAASDKIAALRKENIFLRTELNKCKMEIFNRR